MWEGMQKELWKQYLSLNAQVESQEKKGSVKEK